MSALIERLGLMLAHSLWQGVLVAALLSLMLRWMKLRPARERYSVACISLLAFAALVVGTFFRLGSDAVPIMLADPTPSGIHLPLEQPAEPVSTLVTDTMEQDDVQLDPSEEQAHVVTWKASWQGWSVLVWCGGVVGLSLWHLVGWLGLQRLRRRGISPLENSWERIVRNLKSRLGCRASVQVYWSAAVSGPVTFGWVKPIVLLPLAMASRFSTQQVEMVLAHELAHIRRCDYLANLVLALTVTLFFYHPAVHWIRVQILREREHACDDLAVAAVGDPIAYARSLTDLAEWRLAYSSSLALAAHSGGKGALYLRVQRLLQPPVASSWVLPQPSVGLAMLLALGLLLLPTVPVATADVSEPPFSIPPRGAIKDRHEVLLAYDARDYAIGFDLNQVMEIYARNHGLVTDALDEEELDISSVFEEVCGSELKKLNLTSDYNAKHLRDHFADPAKRGSPWVYRSGLSSDEVRLYPESIPALRSLVLPLRRYPLRSLFSHSIGYVGWKERPFTVAQGNTGAEQHFERYLAPPPESENTSSRAGKDVLLTLDARYQMIAEQVFREAGIGRGAAVILDVNSGNVLAMLSVPDYDPGVFAPTITREEFTRLRDDPTLPLLDRSTRLYPPGAAFLPVTALAAICHGHEDDTFECTMAGLHYGSKWLKCWANVQEKAHGRLGLREAQVASCNLFFYQLGNTVGIERIAMTGDWLGFGKGAPWSPEGIGKHIGVPTPEKVARVYGEQRWSATSTANIAIGQGHTLATPLEMASVMAAVANGGVVWQPRLLHQVIDSSDPDKVETMPLVRQSDLREHGLTDSGLAALRGGLEDVVRRGSARRVQSDHLRIAGRTGTAQVWRSSVPRSRKLESIPAPPASQASDKQESNVERDNVAWFTCYAPVQQPRWAMAVVVEGAKSGGGVAGPLARIILERINALEAGNLKISPRATLPYEGHLRYLDEVRFSEKASLPLTK